MEWVNQIPNPFVHDFQKKKMGLKVDPQNFRSHPVQATFNGELFFFFFLSTRGETVMQGVLMMLKNNEKSTGARHRDAQEEQATHHDVYAPRWRRTARA